MVKRMKMRGGEGEKSGSREGESLLIFDVKRQITSPLFLSHRTSFRRGGGRSDHYGES